VKRVLVVPIGFVSDHIEILYDIDIAYRRKAESLGIVLGRTRSLNSSTSSWRPLQRQLKENITKSKIQKSKCKVQNEKCKLKKKALFHFDI